MFVMRLTNALTASKIPIDCALRGDTKSTLHLAFMLQLKRVYCYSWWKYDIVVVVDDDDDDAEDDDATMTMMMTI